LFSFRFIPMLVVLLVLTGRTTGHDIPADATVHLLVRPAGKRLQVLVRVPLKSMRDVEFRQTGGGYLDVEQLAPQLPNIANLWIANFVEVYEDKARLPKPNIVATQLSFESDRSFQSFDAALAHATGPGLFNSDHVVWDQLLFDVLLEYPIQSEQSAFSIRPNLEHLAARVLTAVRFYSPGGAVRAYELLGDPGIVPLDPGWFQAAWRFVQLGFVHILEGADHLLFLVCLVIPFRRLHPLLLVVSAFTVAHSFTLIASAYGLAPSGLWFPPLIETLIAASILYMALENIAGAGSAHRRWMMAFGFGLVHGFGFSFALRESLQFAGSHLLTSLLSFNIGVELGQILVLLLLLPLLDWLFRFVVAERMGTIILSALVAHTGWHWMLDRGNYLRQFSFEWPAPSAAVIMSALRWLVFAVGFAALVWAVSRLVEKRAAQTGARKETLRTQPY
jgi:hypothetical protein